MIVITERPIKTISVVPLLKSSWNAAHNPLIFKYTCSGIASVSYYTVVEIYETTSGTLLGKSVYKPFLSSTDPTQGNVKANLSNFIKGYLKCIYANPISVNVKDIANTLSFYIKITENDSTGLLNTLSDESNPVFATKSVKQIGELYGQNLGEYVPFGQGTLQAKFLTKFKQPRYFTGYPFTLSFIFSEGLAATELKKLEDELDINAITLTNTETALDISQVNAVNLLKLNEGYDSDRSFIDVCLKTGAPSPERYVYEGYVSPGYTEVL